MWLPFLERRPFPWADAQLRDHPIDTRILCLHTAVSGGSSLYYTFANGGENSLGVHCYVRWDGTGEQYLDSRARANAQYAGNPICFSVETEDNLRPDLYPWSAAQLSTIAHIGRTLGITAVIVPERHGHGVGWHEMWGCPDHSPDGWNWNAHRCPGRMREPQIPLIVAAMNTNPTPPPPPPEDDMTSSNAVIADDGIGIYVIDGVTNKHISTLEEGSRWMFRGYKNIGHNPDEVHDTVTIGLKGANPQEHLDTLRTHAVTNAHLEPTLCPPILAPQDDPTAPGVLPPDPTDVPGGDHGGAVE